MAVRDQPQAEDWQPPGRRALSFPDRSHLAGERDNQAQLFRTGHTWLGTGQSGPANWLRRKTVCRSCLIPAPVAGLAEQGRQWASCCTAGRCSRSSALPRDGQLAQVRARRAPEQRKTRRHPHFVCAVSRPPRPVPCPVAGLAWAWSLQAIKGEPRGPQGPVQHPTPTHPRQRPLLPPAGSLGLSELGRTEAAARLAFPVPGGQQAPE